MKHSVKLSTSWAKKFQLLTDKKGTHFQVKNSNWIKSIRIWSHNWVLRSRKVNLMLEFIDHLSALMMSIDLFSIKGSALENLFKLWGPIGKVTLRRPICRGRQCRWRRCLRVSKIVMKPKIDPYIRSLL